jgi:hypothetical protein
VPTTTELAGVSAEIDVVLQTGLEGGPVGVGLAAIPRLGRAVGPPMRETRATRLLGAAQSASAGHGRSTSDRLRPKGLS